MEKKTTYHMGGKPYYGISPAKKASSAESKKSIVKDKSASQNVPKKDHSESRKKIKYDAEYIAYVKNGESAAVFITRDIAKEIPTDGMWVDVIDCEGYPEDNVWDFQFIKVELFKKRIKPVYPPNSSDEDRKYITWCTAHEDISKQRKEGIHGPKYKLINRNKGKYRKVKAVWNNRFDRWVPEAWFVRSTCEWREKKIPLKPKWDYEIKSWKKI